MLGRRRAIGWALSASLLALSKSRTARAAAEGPRRIVSAKTVGHTSVVFRIDCDDGSRFALKPRSRRGKNRYRGEIAAYRLARALELDSVPEAHFERIAVAELVTALGGPKTIGGRLAVEQIAGDADGRAGAALIAWVPKLEYLPLERPSARDFALREKSDGKPTELASQLATLVLFDFVTGNWDRWSGGNVGYVRETRRVIFVDNDGAFFDPVPKEALARQLAIVKALEFLPARFIDAAATLDAEKLTSALGEERAGTPLLSESVQRGVLDRIATVTQLSALRR